MVDEEKRLDAVAETVKTLDRVEPAVEPGRSLVLVRSGSAGSFGEPSRERSGGDSPVLIGGECRDS